MNKIKELRLEKGLSQYDLADKLNILQSKVSRWENEGIEPNVASPIQLADFFGVSIDELVGRSNVVGIVEVTNELTTNEKNLVDAYRQMNSAEKTVLNDYADVIINRHKKEMKDSKKIG